MATIAEYLIGTRDLNPPEGEFRCEKCDREVGEDDLGCVGDVDWCQSCIEGCAEERG